LASYVSAIDLAVHINRNACKRISLSIIINYAPKR
jgi:hypothetical protein